LLLLLPLLFLSIQVLYAVSVCVYVSEHHRHKLKQEKAASALLQTSNVSYRIHLPGEHDGLSHSPTLSLYRLLLLLNQQFGQENYKRNMLFEMLLCVITVRDAGAQPVKDEGILMHHSIPKVQYLPTLLHNIRSTGENHELSLW
jgi:hypothetical protein